MCVGSRRRKPDGNQLPSFRGSPENTAVFACALQEKRSCGQKNGGLVCASTAQITSGGRGKMGRSGKWVSLNCVSFLPAPPAPDLAARTPKRPRCNHVNRSVQAGLFSRELYHRLDSSAAGSGKNALYAVSPPHRLNCSCRRHPSWALHH